MDVYFSHVKSAIICIILNIKGIIIHKVVPKMILIGEKIDFGAKKDLIFCPFKGIFQKLIIG